MKPLNILFLSSRLPSHSAGLAQDMMDALTDGGHHVTFGYPGIEKDIYKATHKSFLEKLFFKFDVYEYTRALHLKLKFIKPIYFKNAISKDGMAIFNPNEKKPPVSARKVVNRLKGPYDLCIILFWQNIFSTKTLYEIYKKFKCPIIMSSVDMMPMTGGCYYFGTCRNFYDKCGFCPILDTNKENDLTRKNWLYKKECYDKMDLAYLCNSWMKTYAVKSHLFDKSKIYLCSLILDENVYKPLNITECRHYFNIPDNKTIVLLTRYRNMARKGMDTLSYGINKLYESIKPEDRDKILLLLIGENNRNASTEYECSVKQLGFLNKDELIKAYNASTAFLCSSTEDAGPSMINQSIACGTPCVAYDTGTAIDVIHDGVDGFKAKKIGDKDEWSECLYKLYKLSPSEYEQMRTEARKTALKYDSKEAFLNLIEKIFIDFKKEKDGNQREIL